ncbi:HI1506-related protein [Kiloniella litopenaei]|uniref:HI1506-related protein n=1 Tax=Kiloniella litopenaei TaxID=1549748 RepID=UPI003BAA570D
MPKISIVSRKDSFRRAGYKFGKEPVILDTADLDEKQAALLKNEPLLIVQEVKEEEAPKTSPSKTAKGGNATKPPTTTKADPKTK